MRRRSFGDEAAIEAGLNHLLRQFNPLDELQSAPEAAAVEGGVNLEPAFFVAASDASAESKAVAHFLVNGTNDEIEINDALNLLPDPVPVGGKGTGPRGIVHLSEGVFHCNGDVNMPGGTALLGRGKGTLFDSNGTTGLRFNLNSECELGNFGLTETTARSGGAALIDAAGNPTDLLIHDIFVFAMLSPTTHFIDLSTAGSGGRIWNNYVAVGLGDGMDLDGDFDVWSNRFVDFDTGLRLGNGKCHVYGNDFDALDKAIVLTNATADILIGPNAYRSLNTPFEDVTTAVTKTRFSEVHTATWSLPGLGTVNTGVQRLHFSEQAFIVSVRLIADTAGTGTGNNLLDVHLNGTTIFTTQGNRPALAAAATDSGLAGPDVRDVAAGDFLTIDIDEVTATTAASDMIALVRYAELPVL